MASQKQKVAARKNIKKAQLKWRTMTSRQRSLAQPEGRKRAKPGTKGEGKYYRIVVRPKNNFVSFRAQDIGRKGHAIRLAGKRTSGSWDTQAWLINKKDAHVENGFLVADDKKTEDIFSKQLNSKPKRFKGDVFNAKPRRNVPEKEKPTFAQRKAQMQNIRKAQMKRWEAPWQI